MFLDLDTENVLQIPANTIATECTVVLGMRGSGKSNSVARILEQSLGAGVTASIIDPHNEYAGLRERFPVYIAGSGADLPIQPQHGAILARWVYDNGASIILAIKDFSTEDRQRFLLAYTQTLKRLHMANRRAHMLVVEEAHNFIPQVGNNPLKHELGLIAVEGRKFGLGMLISDQRSANIDKTVLGQAGVLLLHRATGVTDLNTYQDIADLPDTKQLARRLTVGEAIAILHYDVSFEPRVVKIKQRDTTHGGDTPALVNVPGVVSEQSISALAALLAKHGEDEESEQAKKIRNLQAQLDQRDQRLAEMTVQNARLQERVEILSMIKVQVDREPQPTVMDVEQINAEQIVTRNGTSAVATQNAPAPVHTAPKTDLHASIEKNAQLLNSHAQKLQRRGFEDLLKAIRSAERFQVMILKALISHKDFVAVQRLAAITGYNWKTISSNGMGKIKQLGLVDSRPRVGYRSKVREVLQERFPALDTDQLITEILEINR